MKTLLVVSNPKTWPITVEGVDVISSRDYLSSADLGNLRRVRVVNACGDYRYQSWGYYVSLLAEARGHRVVPSVRTIQDLKVGAVVRIESEDLEELIRTSLTGVTAPEFSLDIYFGETPEPAFQRVAGELSRLFHAPFLRARFTSSNGWSLRGLRAISVSEIPEEGVSFARAAAERHFKRRPRPATRPDQGLPLDLAILVDPDEQDPPSNSAALKKLVQAAERAGFDTELIGRDDYGRIGEFDALFIRQTTAVHDHTYRFASRAQSEGLAVIDDPMAILRCTNKVFLSELMRVVGVKTPETLIVYSDTRDEVEAKLGLPCVLKTPDSSFSRGVHRAETRSELSELLEEMFKTADVLIAQEYLPTEFDWRIGVLDGRPLFACKYFMARGHWQVYNWAGSDKGTVEGGWETLPVEEAPAPVVKAAVKAATAVGQGLFGVDLKEVDSTVLLVEVNDNPNLDAGVEDQVLGDALYDQLIQAFRTRLERKMDRVLNG